MNTDWVQLVGWEGVKEKSVKVKYSLLKIYKLYKGTFLKNYI